MAGRITNEQAIVLFISLFSALQGEIAAANEQFGLAKAQWQESSDHLSSQLSLAAGECSKINEKMAENEKKHKEVR